MPNLARLTHSPLVPHLLQLMGMRVWALDLDSRILSVQTQPNGGQSAVVHLAVDKLAGLLNTDDMSQWSAHWTDAARNGFSGPATLPFLGTAGDKVAIQSVCYRDHAEDRNLLVGYYRVQVDETKMQKRVRLLQEFLDSLLHNSPSCMMVFDTHKRLINGNEALRTFLGIPNLAPLIGQEIEHLDMVSTGHFVKLVRGAVASPKTCEGKYVYVHRNGQAHNLYWRCYSLSTHDETVRTRVFSFNHQVAGPKAYAA